EERHRPVPESMYGITKYAAERSCLRLATLWDLDVRIGRLAQVFGRWEHASGVRDRLSMPTEIARIARAGGEAVFPPLGDTDYIYAPDVASALIALLTPRRLRIACTTWAPVRHGRCQSGASYSRSASRSFAGANRARAATCCRSLRA